MKLKKNIDAYDVKSLQSIDEGVKKMQKHCEMLCELGVAFKTKVKNAKDSGFQDINMERAEKLINEYLKNMIKAKNEYQELSVSVKEFVQKINDIWSAWR